MTKIVFERVTSQKGKIKDWNSEFPKYKSTVLEDIWKLFLRRDEFSKRNVNQWRKCSSVYIKICWPQVVQCLVNLSICAIWEPHSSFVSMYTGAAQKSPKVTKILVSIVQDTGLRHSLGRRPCIYSVSHLSPLNFLASRNIVSIDRTKLVMISFIMIL